MGSWVGGWVGGWMGGWVRVHVRARGGQGLVVAVILRSCNKELLLLLLILSMGRIANIGWCSMGCVVLHATMRPCGVAKA